MSRTFTKLFSSITESTIWCERDGIRLTWICMLAMADRNGRVWGTVPGIANRARVSVDDCREAINKFMSPDQDSRTKTNEGRRIEEIDGGWRLINHAKYRAIRDEEVTKEVKRNYINNRRAKEKLNDVALDVDKCRSEASTVERSRYNAEAEAEAEATNHGSPPICIESIEEVSSNTSPLTISASQKSTGVYDQPARKRAVRPPAPSSDVWDSYAQAYALRYGVEPVRNAKVNGQLSQLISRLGADDARYVASFFVGHQNSFYVRSMHSVGALLADAEKIRTEWATGRTVMSTQAQQADKTQTNYNVFSKLIAEARAEKLQKEMTHG